MRPGQLLCVLLLPVSLGFCACGSFSSSPLCVVLLNIDIHPCYQFITYQERRYTIYRKILKHSQGSLILPILTYLGMLVIYLFCLFTIRRRWDCIFVYDSMITSLLKVCWMRHKDSTNINKSISFKQCLKMNIPLFWLNIIILVLWICVVTPAMIHWEFVSLCVTDH